MINDVISAKVTKVDTDPKSSEQRILHDFLELSFKNLVGDHDNLVRALTAWQESIREISLKWQASRKEISSESKPIILTKLWKEKFPKQTKNTILANLAKILTNLKNNNKLDDNDYAELENLLDISTIENFQNIKAYKFLEILSFDLMAILERVNGEEKFKFENKIALEKAVNAAKKKFGNQLKNEKTKHPNNVASDTRRISPVDSRFFILLMVASIISSPFLYTDLGVSITHFISDHAIHFVGDFFYSTELVNQFLSYVPDWLVMVFISSVVAGPFVTPIRRFLLSCQGLTHMIDTNNNVQVEEMESINLEDSSLNRTTYSATARQLNTPAAFPNVISSSSPINDLVNSQPSTPNVLVPRPLPKLPINQEEDKELLPDPTSRSP